MLGPLVHMNCNSGQDSPLALDLWSVVWPAVGISPSSYGFYFRADIVLVTMLASLGNVDVFTIAALVLLKFFGLSSFEYIYQLENYEL